MPRIVKEYGVRRNEILDAAQGLIYSKGYDQFTIQDILDEIHIAKGLFYYYFPSKQAMLGALLERMMEALEQVVAPIVQDTGLTALEKFHLFFSSAARWETDQKPLILSLLHIWYRDDNAIVREKIRMMSIQKLAPFLTTVVHQGIAEGVLTTPYPDQAGEIMLSLIQSLEETFAATLLLPEPQQEDMQHMEMTIAAYNHTVEQMLGAPAHSLRLIEAETVQAWFSLRVYSTDKLSSKEEK